MAEKAKETRAPDPQPEVERRVAKGTEEAGGKPPNLMTPEEYAKRFHPVQTYLTESAKTDDK